MDPFSQAVVGGVAGQNVSNKEEVRVAGLVAFFSATLPDLDVLIKSSTDPLLALEYHRQFTHSIAFMPVGGLMAAVLLYYLFARNYLSFRQTAFYCIAGYATHGFLDACTSYGTQLLWPFSDMRIAWGVISIIDPFFTLPLFVLIVMALIKRRLVFARAALIFGLSYILLGVVQHHRAIGTGKELAFSRGHEPGRINAKASLGNMIVWKTVYEHDNRFYVDAVRLSIKSTIIEGESVAKLDVKRDFPWLDLSAQQARDIERFAWFSNDFLSVDRGDENTIVDMRYSMLPNSADALWGIKLSPGADSSSHVVNVDVRQTIDSRSALKSLWSMILGSY